MTARRINIQVIYLIIFSSLCAVDIFRLPLPLCIKDMMYVAVGRFDESLSQHRLQTLFRNWTSFSEEEFTSSVNMGKFPVTIAIGTPKW